MQGNLKSFTINWNRSIIIDTEINDDLVKRITAKILLLRQENNDPITIGINSLGGSLDSLSTILSLLTESGQSGFTGKIITVVIQRAYSAAAILLSFGNYAVALKNTDILFHDVRYGALGNVTPESARNAAKRLKYKNDEYSLDLAQKVISRLVWVYIDAYKKFDDVKKMYQKKFDDYNDIVSSYIGQSTGFQSVDLAAFATFLWVKLSRRNDTLIDNVMTRLSLWISMEDITNRMPTYREKGSRKPGILDGLKQLHKQFKGNSNEFRKNEKNIKLFLSQLIGNMSLEKGEMKSFESLLEDSSREYSIHQSMNDKKHIEFASSVMRCHEAIFFNDDLKEKSKEEKQELIKLATPYATILWLFCVQLCRELFEGEHILSPSDAQLLGLVDEVTGGGPCESKREYQIRQKPKEA